MCHVYKTWIRAAYVGGTDYWPNQSNALVVECCTGWTFCWIEWLVVQIISENLISMKRKRTKTFSSKSHCFKQCLMQNLFFYLLANSCRIFVQSAPVKSQETGMNPVAVLKNIRSSFHKIIAVDSENLFLLREIWKKMKILSHCFTMFHDVSLGIWNMILKR